MKHLKYFESVISEEARFAAPDIDDGHHINTIKDLFQDIFDDFGIEESRVCPGPGIYWCIEKVYVKNEDESYFELYIRKYDDCGRADLPTIDISGHIKTLESMGYEVIIESNDYRYYIISITPPKI